MRIVIVGGGTAGWMSAAALARFAPPGYAITLIESDVIGTVGVGEATIPAIRLFNDALEIDEGAFLAATKGSFKLGIEFAGWVADGHSYMHAFGQVGRQLGLLPFRHFWARGRALGLAKPLAHYSANELAARTGRMAVGASGPGIPEVPYAYHFDAGLYAEFLRAYAEERGVIRIEATLQGATRTAEGDIAAVVTDDGRTIAGDFFIDCSGFRGLLIEQELQTGYDDWRDWLPCDRAIAVPCEPTGNFTPYTRSTARAAGWQWRIPLQHRIGNGHVFCSTFMSDDEAAAVLLANLDGKPLADPRTIPFVTGRRKQIWNRNVLAVGLSSGFLEPLESTSIHLIQSTITRLLTVLPGKQIDPAVVAGFNRRSAAEFENIRDFLVLHYWANQRTGQPFWDRMRTLELPETLQQRIDEYRAINQIQPSHDELFTEVAWFQVLAGQGLTPRSWNPIADRYPQSELERFLVAVEQAAIETVRPMSMHIDCVAAVCGAAKTEKAA
ncbi:MAG: tryptophan 7-halogenase [Sphingomonadales bacterium]|nr:tryptophan 7-halogenase [Sphingomonadales bacterium]